MAGFGLKPATGARLPLAALSLFAAAVIGFGWASPDYAQLRHPVALLGARGEPHAWAFDLTAFVSPGLLLAWQAARWRRASADAGWAARIGLQLAMLSAVAFSAQGLLPLNPYDLLAPVSRLHATAWMAWWIAFAPGAMLLALAKREGRAFGLTIALLLPACALFGAALMPAALAQRLAFLLWFAWWIAAARSK